MVKHSLWKMLDKYPYFLDKRRISNLYKVTKVNNSVFRDLYNSLFHTYQSFHLNKKLLTWRTQTEPYSYQTHFCCGYPNIKSVEIHKNNILIHKEEFTEEEEKTDFCWTYNCSYAKTNMLPIKMYRCTTCDTIYFGDDLPVNCTTDNCNSNTYIQTKAFRCNTCGEYYFAGSVNDLTDNHAEVGEYTTLTGYKCSKCGELYEQAPISCKSGCDNPSYERVTVYKCGICGDLHEEMPVSESSTDSYTEVYAFRCMGNHNEISVDEHFEEIDGLSNDSIKDIDCGELYLGVQPPEVCKICGASGIAETKELYYDDETLMVIDNSTDYETYKVIEMDEGVELNHINDSILVNTDKKLFVRVIDTAGNLLENVNVELYSYQHLISTLKTNNKGLVEFPLDITQKYTQIKIQCEGFVSINGDSLFNINLNWDYINENYLLTVKLISIKVYNKLNTYVEEEGYSLRSTELSSINDSGEILRVPIPVIPDDKFLFHVETWDEYWITKGYPENDNYEGDYFDHDFSLDEIGDLNNIPRKTYIDVANNNLYPLTEPPYNKYLTEDDYHYMKRMIEYNLRLWVSLLRFNDFVELYDNRVQKNVIYRNSDNDFPNYLNILERIGVSEEDYWSYIDSPRSFKEEFNPVTLEFWKNYSVPSKLVNREKHILKLFDLRKHNSKYTPYKVDSDGNPIKVYNKWELDSDGNPLNSSVGKLVYKDKWDVVTDLSECWMPQEWEHKDKFCDGSGLYRTYFFVEAETLRPLPYESVRCDFKLMNSLAESVSLNYHVKLQYYRGDESRISDVVYKDENDSYSPLIVTDDDFCYLSYKLFSNSKPTTVRFKCYETDYASENIYRTDDDNFIGSVDIIFTPRNSCNADFYVDINSTESIEDGSITYPFKSLQTALDKVSSNKDVICLKSDIEIMEPFFVPNSCKILGLRQRNVNTQCEIEQGVVNVPVIRNSVDRVFFNIIGNKSCQLKLIDLRLAHGMINSYIGLSTWKNNNRKLEDYERVIIHGGLARLSIVLDKEEYYPSDLVQLSIYITDKNNNPIGNQKVKLVFDNDEEILLEDTEGEGVINYILHINKNEIGIYNLIATLQSDIYFNSSVVLQLNCTKEPITYVSDGGSVNISYDYGISDASIKVYIDGEYVETIISDSSGKIEYEYTPNDFNSHTILFVDDADNVIYMVVVEVKVDINQLIGQKFIKNFEVNRNGDITYDTVTITDVSTLKDFDGVIIDLSLNGNNIETTKFNVKTSRQSSTEIYSDEALILKNAITSITYSNDMSIGFTRIGEFWRG